MRAIPYKRPEVGGILREIDPAEQIVGLLPIFQILSGVSRAQV